MTTLAVLIRTPAPGDAPALARIHAEAWHEAYAGIIPALTLRRMLARHGPGWWQRRIERGASEQIRLLVFDGEVAGYVVYGPARSIAERQAGEITELYLAPVYQGIGFGRRLFEAARKEMVARGCRRLIVRCLADNDRAVRFYSGLSGRVIASGRERVGEDLLPSVLFGWRL